MSRRWQGRGSPDICSGGSGDELKREGWAVTLEFGGGAPAVPQYHPVLMCAVEMFGPSSREMPYKHLFRSV